MTSPDTPPLLLCIGGHDPSGGAGIQADAEAARAAGAHATSVITCLTTQDTCGLRRLYPQPAELVDEQCRLLLGDSSIGAIKVGLIGSSRIARSLASLAAEHSHLPLVLDPVLASGAGESVTDAALLNQLRTNLLAHCSLITPNLPEAQALAGGGTDPEACARRLLSTGCSWVLITGTHEARDDVVNRLFGRDGTHREWTWPRLPHSYHGSGCTLASAIAARLALGMELVEAVAEAQGYTWASLHRAWRTGRCQYLPNRLYALDDKPTDQP